jgi:hypothetical protein
MRGSFRFHLILLLATAFAGPTLADTDPSLSQVYEAVRTGHLEQAQKMTNQVLRDHPKSAKAHYVAAEVNAASGNFVLASPDHSQTGSGLRFGALAAVVIGVGAGAILALVFMRRRSPSNVYLQPREMMPPPAAGSPATAAAAGFPPSAGTGIGPGIASGLAGGLAAGAGIVAGEEIARHLLSPGEHDVSSPLASEIAQEQHASADFGGPDFGVSDASSWDDDDQASGGDDWT